MLGRNRERRAVPERALPSHLERRGKTSGASQNRLQMRDRMRGYIANHQAVARDSLQRLLAVPLASAMTWAVIAIALALPCGLYLFLQNAQQLSGGWDRSVQISVFMQLQTSEAEGEALSGVIGERSDVASANYISRDQALQEFRALSGFGEALDYLSDNPLPAVIVVQPAADNSFETTQLLVNALQSMPGIDQVQLDMAWVQRLYSIMALGQRAVLILGCLLALAVLLVIGNTIRLAIEARRDEIVVVKLVGATDAFVRRPFLYTGIWYGLGGGLLAWLLINLALFWLSAPVDQLVNSYNNQFELAGLGILSTLLLLLMSAALGLAGAWIAVGRHLSAIEPR